MGTKKSPVTPSGTGLFLFFHLPFLRGGEGILATSYFRTPLRRTIIGAAAFHFRVRNGNGWGHCAMITRVRNRTGISLRSQRRRHEAESLMTKEPSLIL